MTPDQFNQWLADMKSAGIAKTDGECAILLGVSRDTMTRMKQNGADQRTALACSALMHGLEPYKGD